MASEQRRRSSQRRLWDVFISYAGEDRVEVVEPLEQMMLDGGLKVWVGYKELEVGDSLMARIGDGLLRSRFGIVILSHSFFAKRWPKRELEGLFDLDSSEGRTLLPVWHTLSQEDVRAYNPLLAGRLALETSDGIEHVGIRLFERITGVRTARLRAQRRRMIAIRRASAAFSLTDVFTASELRRIVGVGKERLSKWSRLLGIGHGAEYSVRDMVTISALYHWSATGVKLTNPMIGSLYYAVRAAKMPFVLVRVDSWVYALPVEEVVQTLSGGASCSLYDPERLLLAVHDQRMANAQVTSSSSRASTLRMKGSV